MRRIYLNNFAMKSCFIFCLVLLSCSSLNDRHKLKMQTGATIVIVSSQDSAKVNSLFLDSLSPQPTIPPELIGSSNKLAKRISESFQIEKMETLLFQDAFDDHLNFKSELVQLQVTYYKNSFSMRAAKFTGKLALSFFILAIPIFVSGGGNTGGDGAKIEFEEIDFVVVDYTLLTEERNKVYALQRKYSLQEFLKDEDKIALDIFYDLVE